jgi:succinate dehydrogenase hydrophobic anchor subunit
MNRANVWAWLLQRTTAVLLIVLLGTHFWVTHYQNLGEIIIFETVQLRLKDITFILVDAGLLGCAIYHALNGLRAVLFDFTFFAGHKRILNWALVLIGVVTLIYGGYGLFVFLR